MQHVLWLSSLPTLGVGGVLVLMLYLIKCGPTINLTFLTTQNMMEMPLMVVLLSLLSYLAIRMIQRLDRMLELSISVQFTSPCLFSCAQSAVTHNSVASVNWFGETRVTVISWLGAVGIELSLIVTSSFFQWQWKMLSDIIVKLSQLLR